MPPAKSSLVETMKLEVYKKLKDKTGKANKDKI